KITNAGPDKKPGAVWSVVNQLTGSKRCNALNLAGDTPEERRNELQTFFSGIAALPDESFFNTSPIIIDEVLQLAKKMPGNKATGPDDVSVEILHLPQVALEVKRVMNCVLAGGRAPAEWRTAQIIGIPKRNQAPSKSKSIAGSQHG
uniref:RNA-directed DNA polymerase from mobile element jockey n=1 Tax=Macrostomum lignano TaxID=282301 RepID=A0A1I8HBS0_9PLAT